MNISKIACIMPEPQIVPEFTKQKLAIFDTAVEYYSRY